MVMHTSKLILTKLLEQAGISINGNKPYDIQVHDDRFYSAVIGNWSLGLGESYMQGFWSCKQMDEMIHRLLTSNLDRKQLRWNNVPLLLHYLKSSFLNLQSMKRAFQVGQLHYDLGNTFFTSMLDPYMQYSCAYWKNAQNLDQAQQQKLEMVCQKLYLKPNDRVLEIGCGWGGFAAYAIKKYNINYTGISVSKEQIDYAKKKCRNLNANFKLMDYRKISGQYDKIVSIGMFEHVGRKNYADFFELAYQHLKDEGLFLLHTIGCSKTKIATDPWVHKYIFPNGYIPSYQQISKNIEGYFHIEDWHNFGFFYDHTLMAWHQNFSKNWSLHEANYPKDFYRMWEYYLLSCAGYFRAKKGQLWQIMLTKLGSQKKYISYRP